jgi:Protein of unknown function (DUF1573)
MMNANRSALHGLLVATVSSVAIMATTAIAKPPDPHEGHNHDVPNHLKAIQATQPAKGAKAGTPAAAAQPPAPQGTIQLKPGEVPQIEFDTPIYDFGKLRTGKDVEHDFWFHNPGNGPLEILQVKPS